MPTLMPHTHSIAEVCQGLETDSVRGLTEEAAAECLLRHGPNELLQKRGTPWWHLLLKQFQNVLILILLAGAGLSLALGHGTESIAIAVIVIFAVFLGFIQEFRAEKALDALQKMAAPLATVIRNGVTRTIESRLVVPGDLISLTTGNRVPADARLIESRNLKADEAALTGESVATEKHSDVLADDNLALGDRKNMVYAGTAIAYGRGLAIATGTGMQTEFGKIATLLQGVEAEATPLQKNLDQMGNLLAKFALGIVAVIAGIGIARGEPILDVFIFAIALAVAVVPEALPAVVTISLAIGVQKMARRHALVRRLPAVETLGSTTVICSDKTGTLTKDEMTIRQVYCADEWYDVSGSGYSIQGEFTRDGKVVDPSEHVLELFQGGILSSDAKLQALNDGSHDIHGDPTEGAFLVAGAKAGLERNALHSAKPRIAEEPFSSETKRMATLHKNDDSHILYMKGALESILPLCTRKWGKNGEEAMTEADRTAISAAAASMATRALRVIAVARRGGESDLQKAMSELKFVGMVGMIDPPRSEAKDAIATCHRAGIRVIMITGDHPVTAEAIAKELGIIRTNATRVVTGPELEAMSDTELENNTNQVAVFARVSPTHKLRIVSALQRRGHVVAMTGDGVNDAPALKKADIGIAMGITGTDVSKEAAAMTLTNDNFASIVAAIEEGRSIFRNIKKYLVYLLSANIGEIGLMTGATLIGWPLPLTAVQILYVNLATDGLPALALAVDPHDDDVMKEAPRNAKQGIFTRSVTILLLTGGIWSSIVNLCLYWWADHSGRDHAEAMTMTFVTLVLIEFLKAYSYRSQTEFTFYKPFRNKWLNLSVVFGLLCLLAIVYIPVLQVPFSTFALTLEDWVIVSLAALTIVPVLDIAKVITKNLIKTPATVAAA